MPPASHVAEIQDLLVQIDIGLLDMKRQDAGFDLRGLFLRRWEDRMGVGRIEL